VAGDQGQRGVTLGVRSAGDRRRCLPLASQFVDYRAVEVGQPGYAGCRRCEAPTGADAVDAHSYLLVR
jgi:hypothetical protein